MEVNTKSKLFIPLSNSQVRYRISNNGGLKFDTRHYLNSYVEKNDKIRTASIEMELLDQERLRILNEIESL